MEAAFQRASFFKKFVKSFERVVQEFLLVCDRDGIRYSGMDATQVVIVAFQLRANVFHRYICKPPNMQSEILLGLSQHLLSQLLQIIPDDSALVIQDAGDRLKIFAEDGTMKGVEHKSDIGILELHREFHELPKDEHYLVTIQFPSDQFSKCIKDLSNIGSDHITIRAVPATEGASNGLPIGSGMSTPIDDDATQREANTTSLSHEDDVTVTTGNEKRKTKSGSSSKLILEGNSATGSLTITFFPGQGGFNHWNDSVEICQSFPLKFLRDHTTNFCSLCDKVTMLLGGEGIPLELKFPLEAVVGPTASKGTATTPDSDSEAADEFDVEAPHRKAARKAREAKDARKHCRAGSDKSGSTTNPESFVAFYVGSLVRVRTAGANNADAANASVAVGGERAGGRRSMQSNTEDKGLFDDDEEMGTP